MDKRDIQKYKAALKELGYIVFGGAVFAGIYLIFDFIIN